MKSIAHSGQLSLNFEGETLGGSPARTQDQDDLPTSASAAPVQAHRLSMDVSSLMTLDESGMDFPQLAARAIESANADLHAIDTWVAARCDDAERDDRGRPANSAAVYRREARRFVLWLAIERGASLDEARLEDALAYRTFLADPQPRARWCAPRGTRVGTPQWRPFEGPLCARARRQSITVLSCLFRFLQDQQVVRGNPWSGVGKPRNSEPRVDPGRSLSREQWRAVEDELAGCSRSLRDRQLAWAVRFLYSTGLRLSELVSSTCGDLRWVSFDSSDLNCRTSGDVQAVRGSWVFRVLGKGLKLRDVPVDARLIDELGDLLLAQGDSNDPRDHAIRPLLLHLKLNDSVLTEAPQRGLTAQGLHRQIKQLFSRAAERMARDGYRHEAAPLLRATTHWLRHTCATHSVEAGVSLDVISRSLGHADLQVTSVYISSQDLRRRAREGGKLALAMARP